MRNIKSTVGLTEAPEKSKNRIVNVAVIDSGLSSYMNIKLSERITAGRSYDLTENSIDISDEYLDSCIHGTACVSLISRLSPNAHFYIMKILNKDGRTHGSMLLNALHDLRNSNIKVINLSLATKSIEYINEMQEICRELCNEGKVLLASQANNFTGGTYPAFFDSVIGVEGGDFYNRDTYWFDRSKPIQCIADGAPLITQIDDEHIFFKGNSKANALLTSKVANIIAYNSKDMDYYEICKVLENDAARNNWNQNDVTGMRNVNVYHPDEALSSELVKKVEKVLMDFFKLSSVNRDMLQSYMYDKYTGFKVGNCTSLLKFLKNELEIKINYENISILDFYNIESLCSAIYRKWTRSSYEEVI